MNLNNSQGDHNFFRFLFFFFNSLMFISLRVATISGWRRNLWTGMDLLFSVWDCFIHMGIACGKKMNRKIKISKKKNINKTHNHQHKFFYSQQKFKQDQRLNVQHIPRTRWETHTEREREREDAHFVKLLKQIKLIPRPPPSGKKLYDLR